jgi:uncharacterized protein (DUF924 family)
MHNSLGSAVVRLLLLCCYCFKTITVGGFATSSSMTTTTTADGEAMTPSPVSAAARVAAFAAQPLVQRAVQSPMSIRSVLNFFYGIETDTAVGSASLRHDGGSIFATMSPLWYAGGPDYDALCAAFTEPVRAAGRREWPPPSTSSESATSSPDSYNSVVDGKMAQLLLTDQLARNIFRGTQEAFAYEDVSLEVARELADRSGLLVGGEDKGKFAVPAATSAEEFWYPPYLSFIAVALMHSERLDDQVTCADLLQRAQLRHSSDNDDKMGKVFAEQIVFAQDHRRVVEQFGRFPHRNVAKGRTSTDAETAWLADTIYLPGWARSQSSSGSPP